MNLDTCRCANSSCPIRETCQRWTCRDEWPGRLKRYTHFEPGEDGVCTARISVDSGNAAGQKPLPSTGLSGVYPVHPDSTKSV